jgi:transcriptional regulator of arginine metabolism
MKAQRHAAILRLITANRVPSQEGLRELLAKEGMEVTQATLSRDVRELRLAKIAGPDGSSYYGAPPEPEMLHPPLDQLVPALLLSAEGVGPLLVARTPPGSAEALGGALDKAAWEGVIGTIAGDDTLLIIARSEKSRREITERLHEMAGL